MQIAAPHPSLVSPRHHEPVPELPPVGSVRYERADGSVRSFQVRPFLHQPGDWATRFAALKDAVGAARAESRYWQGLVTFGVVQATEGAFLIRPMESENGRSFTLDAAAANAVRILASATASDLVALVGHRGWIDLSGSDRTDVAPRPFTRV
jgi:hypothetical protein